MVRHMATVGIVLAAAAVLPGAAAASHDPTGEPFSEDFAVGSGLNVEFDIAFVLDAHSDPGGANPRGTVTAELFSTYHLEGPVTCLRVEGSTANIGITHGTPNFGPYGHITVVDNRGARPDTFAGATSTIPYDCVTPRTTLMSDITGDVVVHDAPAVPTSKDQCRNGGWRNYPGFKNQGDCVSFVATGGKNPPAG